MLGRAFGFLFCGVLAAVVVGTALPGPHRVVMAGSFGVVEIAPRVWTDAPARAEALLTLANGARQSVRDFFGDEPPKPTLVLCTTQRCARDFGIRGNGLSVADMTVMVSPGGLTRGTLTHEMTHSRLHRRMGLGNLIRQPYPTWFDEGLATHVADHPTWPGNVTTAARARVRQVTRFWQLRDAFRDLGVGLTYRAAAAEVAAIEQVAGRAGLLELVRRAEGGEAFSGVERDIAGR